MPGCLEKVFAARASDIHFEPTSNGYEPRYRVDGLLHTKTMLASEAAHATVKRLMVFAELPTYRLDVPQEGRAEVAATDARGTPPSIECRVAGSPTIHGPRAVVHLPAESMVTHRLRVLDQPPRGTRAFEDLVDSEQASS